MRWVSLVALAVCGASVAGCANARPEPPGRLVYLALGASDAAGVGAEPITRGYVFQITDELDDRLDQVFLANLGVPGASTEQLDAALELFFETAVEPGLVTVWTGPTTSSAARMPTISRTTSRASSSACAIGPRA